MLSCYDKARHGTRRGARRGAEHNVLWRDVLESSTSFSFRLGAIRPHAAGGNGPVLAGACIFPLFELRERFKITKDAAYARPALFKTVGACAVGP